MKILALLLACCSTAMAQNNDQGGSVHYFGIVRKGSPVVFDPGKPQLWAEDVGAAHSMLFLQQDYKDRGAPDELFYGNPDLVALVHLDVASIDARNDPDWEWFSEHPEALLWDADGHPITAYYTQYDSGRKGARGKCDPKGTKPSGKACMVYRDGEVIEENPDACMCRFSINQGSEEAREFYGEKYKQFMSVAKPGHRRLGGFSLDNSRPHWNWGPHQVKTKRVSGVPDGYTHEQYVEDLKGMLAALDAAVKSINPENISIASACTFAEIDPLNLGYAKSLMEVVDGCMAEQWAMGNPGTPMVNRPELLAFQLGVLSEINGMDKYFIALTANNYPHDTIPPSWQDTRAITDLAHANLMLAWQNPKALLSYWQGVSFSASSTVDKPWADPTNSNTVEMDYPLMGLDCGLPIAGLQLASEESGKFREDGTPIMVPTGLGRRDWSKCIVIANNSNKDVPVKLDDGVEDVIPRGSALIIKRDEEIKPPVEKPGKVLINPGSCICQCDEIQPEQSPN